MRCLYYCRLSSFVDYVPEETIHVLLCNEKDTSIICDACQLPFTIHDLRGETKIPQAKFMMHHDEISRYNTDQDTSSPSDLPNAFTEETERTRSSFDLALFKQLRK